MKNRLLPIILLLAASFFIPHVAAQSSFTVATSVEIQGENIKKGMIVTNDGRNVTLTNVSYDPNMFGIVAESPAITLGKKDEAMSYPIATSGNVPVLVSNANGSIRRGDYITSSSVPGIGMRATVPGRAIGVALQNPVNSSADYNLVMISLNSEYLSATALNRTGDLEGNPDTYEQSQFGDSLLEPKLLSSVKFVSSGIIAIISFAGGIIYYIQISKKEVEALGRNPLASQTIQKNMLFHGIIVVLICLGGLLMAYGVLQL